VWGLGWNRGHLRTSLFAAMAIPERGLLCLVRAPPQWRLSDRMGVLFDVALSISYLFAFTTWNEPMLGKTAANAQQLRFCPQFVSLLPHLGQQIDTH